MSFIILWECVGEYEDDVPSGQKSLFHGYTFMLTQKPKEDGRSGEKTAI